VAGVLEIYAGAREPEPRDRAEERALENQPARGAAGPRGGCHCLDHSSYTAVHLRTMSYTAVHLRTMVGQVSIVCIVACLLPSERSAAAAAAGEGAAGGARTIWHRRC